MTTVGDLFKSVPFPDLIAALENGYEDIHVPSYQHAWKRIMAMTPVDSVMTCCIGWVPKDEFCDGYFDVYGEEGDGERFGIEFHPWAMWLAMPVKVVDCDLSEAQMLAHIMWEMTFFGFDDGTIQEQWQELNDIVESIDDGTADLVKIDLEEMAKTGEVIEVKKK